MPNDAISREAAIEAVTCLQSQFFPGGDISRTCERAKERLASLPADTRWEEAIKEIDDLRCKLFGEGDTAGESALHAAMSILFRLAPAQPNETRRDKEDQ